MSFIIKNNKGKNNNKTSGKSFTDKPDRDFEEADKLLAQLEKMESEERKNDLSSKAKQVIQGDKEAIKKMEEQKAKNQKNEQTEKENNANKADNKTDSKTKEDRSGKENELTDKDKNEKNEKQVGKDKNSKDNGQTDKDKSSKDSDETRKVNKETGKDIIKEKNNSKEDTDTDKSSKESDKEKKSDIVKQSKNGKESSTVKEDKNNKESSTVKEDKNNKESSTVKEDKNNKETKDYKNNKINNSNEKNSRKNGNAKSVNSYSVNNRNSSKENVLQSTKIRKKQPNKLHEKDDVNIKKIFSNSRKYMIIGTTVVVLSIAMIVALALDRKKTDSKEDVVITKSASKFLDDVDTDEMIDTVNGYYQTLVEGDIERARTYLYDCDDITDEEIIKQSEEVKLYNDLIGSSFEITDCYLQDGMQSKEYIAYMKFQIKIKSIETPAVGIFTYYLIDDIENDDDTTGSENDNDTAKNSDSDTEDNENTDKDGKDEVETKQAVTKDEATEADEPEDEKSEIANEDITTKGTKKHNYKLYIELNNPETDIYKYVTRMQKADNVVKLFDAVNKELEEACQKDENLKAIVDALQNNDANISGKVKEQEKSSAENSEGKTDDRQTTEDVSDNVEEAAKKEDKTETTKKTEETSKKENDEQDEEQSQDRS